VEALGKLRKLYPLVNVLNLMRIARPLGVRRALRFYSAPLIWLLYGGRRKFKEFLPETLVLSTRYGFYVIPGSNIVMFFEEVEDIKFLERFMEKGSVFVDVGAYAGFYTIWACRRVEKVVAVEPNPLALAYLRANVALNNCGNVAIVPKAASEGRGVVELRVPKPALAGHIPMSASIVWRHREALSFHVEADTLDSIVEEAAGGEADIVKIDVEGAEGLVVKGAERTLKRAKVAYIEIWPENLWAADYMTKLGYKLYRVVDHGAYKNYLFIKT